MKPLGEFSSPLKAEKESGEKTMENRKKYGRKEAYNNKAAAIVCLLVILILGGIIAVYFLFPVQEEITPSPSSQQTSDSEETSSLMEPDAESTAFYPADYYAEGIEEGSMAYMVNGELLIEPGETVLPLYLEFPAVNTTYLQFELINEETEETLYQSKYLAPGSLLREISIPHTLSSNKTRLTLILSALDPDSLEVIGTAEEYLSVTVKEETPPTE